MSIRKRDVHFSDWTKVRHALVCNNVQGITETSSLEDVRAFLINSESGSNPFYYYVCYIKDSEQIYTHGKIYDCSTFKGSDIKSLLDELTNGEIIDEDKENEIVAKLHYLINQNAGNISVLESEKADKSEVEILKANVDENEEITSAAINDLYSKIETSPDFIGDKNVQSDWNEDDINSDSYIKNKPVIPSEITEDTINNWGFTKNVGSYSKPAEGIPISDLDDDIQASLSKADTAIQEHQSLEEYTKTIDLATVATSGSYNDLSNKPDIPIMPTKLSDLENDEGYITEDNVAYNIVNHGTTDTTFEITPNMFHVWGEVGSLTITFGAETEGIMNEYAFQFTSGDAATTLTLPSDLVWADGDAIIPENNKTYQVSIVNGNAIYAKF